jgi:hypothetical protein
MQPWHFLIRALHVASMAAFFGGIAVLDLRLMGLRTALTLRGLSEHVLPALWWTFGLACMTGVALFLYDPLHVGSHAYFSLKLAFIILGLVNAAAFHQLSFVTALATDSVLPAHAKMAGGLSLALWTLVLIMASLNVEGPPKVLLQ